MPGSSFSAWERAFLLVLPVLFPRFVPAMSPFLNLGLPTYLYALVVLALLVRLELKEQTSRDLYNLLLLLLLLTGFVAVKVQMSSIVQPGQPFRFFFNQSSSMAVGSAAGWLAYGLGLLYWPRGLDRPFRIAGVVLVLAGLAKALTYPFAVQRGIRRHDAAREHAVAPVPARSLLPLQRSP